MFFTACLNVFIRLSNRQFPTHQCANKKERIVTFATMRPLCKISPKTR